MSSTLDDSDPSIRYSQFADDDWHHIGNGKAFEGTMSESRNWGSTATFSFRGTSVQVFGAIEDGLDSSFSIDNGTPDEVFRLVDEKLFEQLLYTSPELDDGQHTLVITHSSDEYPLILDYIIIHSSPPVTSTRTSTATTVITRTLVAKPGVQPTTGGKPSADCAHVSTNTPQACSKSATSSPAPTSQTTTLSPTTTLPPSSSHSSSTVAPSIAPITPTATITPIAASHQTTISRGGIIGLVIGSAVALGTIILLACLWCYRKRRRGLLRPYPLPPGHRPTHAIGPNSSNTGFPPVPISEKARPQALEADNLDQPEVSPRFDDPVGSQSSTLYPSQPATHNIVLAPLRFSATPLAFISEANDFRGTIDTAAAAGRSNQLSTADSDDNNNRNTNPNNNTPQTLTIDTTLRPFINTELPTATTTSSNTFFTRALHFRNISLGRAGARSVASTTRDGSDFDELPPYPGPAGWSRPRTMGSG